MPRTPKIPDYSDPPTKRPPPKNPRGPLSKPKKHRRLIDPIIPEPLPHKDEPDHKNPLIPQKPRLGRPTKYHPAYCEAVVEFGRQKMSLTAFAGSILVSRETLSEWMRQHPDFSAACKQHSAVRTMALERGLFEAQIGPQVGAHIFALKNASPHEWRDKQEIDHQVNLTIADLVEQSFKTLDLRAAETKMIEAPEDEVDKNREK